MITQPEENLFIVSRTSDYAGEFPPHLDAFSIEIPVVDVRYFKSPEEFKARLGQDWFALGTNHRILPNGHIARDCGTEQVWAMRDVDVWKLSESENECLVISIEHGYKRIEIYDDYRE